MKNKGRIKRLLKLVTKHPNAWVHARDGTPSGAEEGRWSKAWDEAYGHTRARGGERSRVCDEFWDTLKDTPREQRNTLGEPIYPGYEPLRDIILALCAYDDLGWVLNMPAQDVVSLYDMGAKQDKRLALCIQTLRSLAQLETEGEK
jgi:diadenosine tetraphosphatase ApaH/serine/threonine PP2A family protein phosphatase